MTNDYSYQPSRDRPHQDTPYLAPTIPINESALTHVDLDEHPTITPPYDAKWAICVEPHELDLYMGATDHAPDTTDQRPGFLSSTQRVILVVTVMYLLGLLPAMEIIVGGLHFDDKRCGHGPARRPTLAQTMVVFATLTNLFMLATCSRLDHPAVMSARDRKRVIPVLLILFVFNAGHVLFQSLLLSDVWATCEPRWFASMLVVSVASRAALAILSCAITPFYHGN